MRIQYASDLHLERYDKVPFPPILKPVAPVLALAGDLGHPGRRAYRDLMHYCSRNWAKVFVVAGNHELYSSPRIIPAETLLERCEATAKEFPNVHFMNRTRIDYEGVSFLGATLWADLSEPNDYRRIFTGADVRLLQPEDTAAWHRRDRAWIVEQLRLVTNPVVLLTHHLPSIDLIRSPLRAIGASPLIVCANPRGYNTGYSRERCIEISTEDGW
jgi:hypothetical protein